MTEENRPDICPNCGYNSDNQTKCCAELAALKQKHKDDEWRWKTYFEDLGKDLKAEKAKVGRLRGIVEKLPNVHTIAEYGKHSSNCVMCIKKEALKETGEK